MQPTWRQPFRSVSGNWRLRFEKAGRASLGARRGGPSGTPLVCAPLRPGRPGFAVRKLDVMMRGNFGILLDFRRLDSYKLGIANLFKQ